MTKTELGITIIFCKESGNWYQDTSVYTFWGPIYSTHRKRISWLRIKEDEAKIVIESLGLIKEVVECHEYIYENYLSKPALKHDRYFKKAHEYYKKKIEKSLSS